MCCCVCAWQKCLKTCPTLDWVLITIDLFWFLLFSNEEHPPHPVLSKAEQSRKYPQRRPPPHITTNDNGAGAFIQRACCVLAASSTVTVNRNYCCTRGSRQRKTAYVQRRQLLFLHMLLSSLAITQAKQTHKHRNTPASQVTKDRRRRLV